MNFFIKILRGVLTKTAGIAKTIDARFYLSGKAGLRVGVIEKVLWCLRLALRVTLKKHHFPFLL